MVSRLGVKNVEFEEIWNLEKSAINELQPVYGFIFLFKYIQKQDPRPTLVEFDPSKIFFAQQTMNNACATNAILNLLLNCHSSVELGPTLSDFRDFTTFFPSEDRGLALSSHDVIRTIHNSYSPPSLFDISRPATKDDDVYHYISYVPIDGVLYELDGLKRGPIKLDDIGDQDWIDLAIQHIQTRMQSYASSEIGFSLLVVTKDRIKVMESEIDELEKRTVSLNTRLQEISNGVSSEDSQFNGTDVATMSDDDISTLLPTIKVKIDTLRGKIASNVALRETRTHENIRRKHDYTSFCLEFIKLLASHGELSTLLNKAKDEKTKKLAAIANKPKTKIKSESIPKNPDTPSS